ncbi:ATP-binding cassette domain-containing protein [Chrysiogenes arsenatis]|uniref:ATP-binding cassette domain-containing protein n=1 Tax=Chrysiogenes arsenatis TaxID=309797 RepID=UPI00041D02D1|nr:ATP-binding cassette domain-containing protein [Chrysiogenes arsenatis]
MKNATDILTQPLASLLEAAPYIPDFFDSYGMSLNLTAPTLADFLATLSEDAYEDAGTTPEALRETFIAFYQGMCAMNASNERVVESLTIIGGFSKSGEPENFELTLRPGDVVSIVGPTGSGKSRLLADIEWVAQKDTPTKRQVLINNAVPDSQWRFSLEHKLVAQLSQNMNFVMDLSVHEFVEMHAESRLIENKDEVIRKIIHEANELAGEKFSADTPVTSLSGGQSRALMIADTAFLSRSPIVLIDEIENAGIDRRKALDLLVKGEKIVLMATHDPILALMASRRLVIRNGAVYKILETSQAEKDNLVALSALDQKILRLRNRLRSGETIDRVE